MSVFRNEEADAGRARELLEAAAQTIEDLAERGTDSAIHNDALELAETIRRFLGDNA